MQSVMVQGTQWGDEGKGKVIDLLSQSADWVVRSIGGNNAGHTIVVGTEEYKFHLIPSGILYPNVKCLIAGGTVVDLASLLNEIRGLEERGIVTKGRLFLSKFAHLIFPFHNQKDLELENIKGDLKVGTTGRGIGPAIADGAHRIALRVGDLTPFSKFEKKIPHLYKLASTQMEKMYGEPIAPLDEIIAQFKAMAEQINPYIADVESMLHDALDRGDKLLFEGAHGTLLDKLFGTYPYVTAASTISAGVCAGAAFPPQKIDAIWGVVKAYQTRVGKGPFPTALSDDDAHTFPGAQFTREIGTTTGRKRDIGWLDIPLLKWAARCNGLSELFVTKVDILDSLERIKICVGYTLDGVPVDTFVSCADDLARVVPIYEEIEGWQCSTRGIRSFDQLPEKCIAYIRRIEELSGVPVGAVSVGPAREETFFVSSFMEKWEG